MSAVNNVNLNANTPPRTDGPTGSGGAQTLTQQDFLKIMVAQFTQQDPLSSGSGGNSNGTTDYVNQLMSMTNLTTMQTMSSQLATSTGQQALQLAQTLPGSTVEVTGNGGITTGVVQKARIDATTNNVYLTIGGKEYSSAALISVDQAAAAATTPPAATATP